MKLGLTLLFLLRCVHGFKSSSSYRQLMSYSVVFAAKKSLQEMDRASSQTKPAVKKTFKQRFGDIENQQFKWEFNMTLARQIEKERAEFLANRKPPARVLHRKVVREEMKRFQRHENDCGSPEVQIAMANSRILHITKHLLANRKDHASKRGLQALVSLRRRCLNYIYKKDKDKALAIATEFGIRFIPPGYSFDRAIRYRAFKNTKSKHYRRPQGTSSGLGIPSASLLSPPPSVVSTKWDQIDMSDPDARYEALKRVVGPRGVALAASSAALKRAARMAATQDLQERSEREKTLASRAAAAAPPMDKEAARVPDKPRSDQSVGVINNFRNAVASESGGEGCSIGEVSSFAETPSTSTSTTTSGSSSVSPVPADELLQEPQLLRRKYGSKRKTKLPSDTAQKDRVAALPSEEKDSDTPDFTTKLGSEETGSKEGFSSPLRAVARERKSKPPVSKPKGGKADKTGKAAPKGKKKVVDVEVLE